MNTENAKKHLAAKAEEQKIAAYQIIDLLYSEHIAEKEAAMDCRKFERDKLLEQIAALKEDRCSECGAALSSYPNGCPLCGAPVCCQQCCKIAALKEELAADRRATKHTMEEMQALLEENAALEKKVDEFDKEICRWASKAKVAEKQIAAKNDLLYVYQNTPFAHWHERALKAEEQVAALRESFRIFSQLNEGLEEQIVALTKEGNRLKLFWDTYAREVDKLAFEAQEEALRGGEVKDE